MLGRHRRRPPHAGLQGVQVRLTGEFGVGLGLVSRGGGGTGSPRASRQPGWTGAWCRAWLGARGLLGEEEGRMGLILARDFWLSGKRTKGWIRRGRMHGQLCVV